MDEEGFITIFMFFGIIIGLIFLGGAQEAIPENNWGWVLAFVGAVILTFVVGSLIDMDGKHLLSTTTRFFSFMGGGVIFVLLVMAYIVSQKSGV